MCDNRPRCEACRTINLAKHVKHPKSDMQMYDKCTPVEKHVCKANQPPEVPLYPTCIKVCSPEEYKYRKTGKKPLETCRVPHYAHGKLMYAVKAGILVSAVYFTYTQGVWGDQQEVTECIKRWQEYVRSINTRRPPSYDHCGNVIQKENPESIFAPAYNIYKEIITTCFTGIVKVPLIIKCAYLDYCEAMKKKEEQEKLKKK